MPIQRNSNLPQESITPSQRELIVLAKPTSGLRAGFAAVASVAGADVDPLNAALRAADAKMVPLFGNEDRIAMTAPPGASAFRAVEAPEVLARMASFYKVEAPDTKLDELANSLLKTGVVDAAYVRPRVEPPFY